jgi:hypothetical protein
MKRGCEQHNHCNHPAVKNCSRCRIGLCSAHLVECLDCKKVFCRECAREHPCQKTSQRQLAPQRGWESQSR